MWIYSIKKGILVQQVEVIFLWVTPMTLWYVVTNVFYVVLPTGPKRFQI